MKRSDLSIAAIIALIFSTLSIFPAHAAYPDPPQGSGYPYTRVIAGQNSTADCPSGFQHATGLISDLSWPRGQRSFTECWPEAAFVANRIGGNTWQAFKDSGGTLSVDELYAVQQAWRDYYQAIEDAQSAAEAESRQWNEANPGKQKCVQWGPIVAPDGVGQSSGGVCANPVEAPSDPSSSPEASGGSSSTPSSSEQVEEVGSPAADESGPPPSPSPTPTPAPEGNSTISESAPISSSTDVDTPSESDAASSEERIAIPEPTNLKLTSDTEAVYLTIENGKAKKVSVRFAGKWSVFYPTSDLETKAFFPGQSGFVSITVYVDGALKLSNFVRVETPRTQPESPESGDTPSTPQGSGQPFTTILEGQVGKSQCPTGSQYANGLIVDVSTGKRFTECWPEAAYLAWSIGGETWSAYKASNGATSLEALRKALEQRNTVATEPTQSPSVEETATESEELTPSVSPLIKLSRNEDSVEIQVLNGEGMKLSARIAGRWLVTYLPDDDHIVSRRVMPGSPVQVLTYLDGELMGTETLSSGEAAEIVPVNVPPEVGDDAVDNESSTSTDSNSISKQAQIEVLSDDDEIEFRILNAAGRKVSIQVGGRWLVEYPSSELSVVRTTSVKGAIVPLRLFLDSVFLNATTVTVGGNQQSSVAERGDSVTGTSSESVTQSPTSTSAEALGVEVEFSSLGGQIYIDLENAESKRVSVKVGGRWFVFYPDSNRFRYSITSLAGTAVAVTLYVDGNLRESVQLTVAN